MTAPLVTDPAKRAAGRFAVDHYLRDGMRIGLGSGTTATAFVEALGERVRAGLDIAGVPTSPATRDLAQALGIPLLDLNDVEQLDLAIDGADEIDPLGRMIKGGGGYLLWEKMVASVAGRFIALVDQGKRVARLGRFPLPVEVVPFGWRSTERAMRRVFAGAGHAEVPIALRGGEAIPLLTASGHYLLDCRLGAIEDAEALTGCLNAIPGVVENGLFLGIAGEMVVGHPDGRAERVALPAG